MFVTFPRLARVSEEEGKGDSPHSVGGHITRSKRKSQEVKDREVDTDEETNQEENEVTRKGATAEQDGELIECPEKDSTTSTAVTDELPSLQEQQATPDRQCEKEGKQEDNDGNMTCDSVQEVNGLGEGRDDDRTLLTGEDEQKNRGKDRAKQEDIEQHTIRNSVGCSRVAMVQS